MTRTALIAAAVLIATLATLWAGFVAGVWMAVHVGDGPTLTQAVTGLALGVALVIVARAYQLVIRTIREEPQA